MNKTAKTLMIQGTSSHVGKSLITAAILRILKRRGIKAAPFKPQNMALNSAVVKGGEIGRAQALQALAAGVEPTVDLNPVLLKPTTDSAAQVIIHGKVHAAMSARDYHCFKKEAMRFVMESFERLASDYDVIVIEGAGSPAEINLRENDIANMGMALMIGSPVLIVGDIDRGGVFASLLGTMALLTDEEKELVKGFIINKFRGDSTLLAPGIEALNERAQRPVLGVVPYIKGLRLPDEDSVALEAEHGRSGHGQGVVVIAVIKLPRISNFTDFDPLKGIDNVRLSFVEHPEHADLKGADMVIIPGTKNTLGDLNWLRERGLETAIQKAHRSGAMIAGICGGFQMLGTSVKDPYGVESGSAYAQGLGLINADTVLERDKKTFEVKAMASLFGAQFDIKGYEIHAGETQVNDAPFATITKRGGTNVDVGDGAAVVGSMLWGTYIHGIFDNDRFTQSLVGRLRKKKGISREAGQRPFSVIVEESIDLLADTVAGHVDITEIYRIMGL
ncbi:MAG: cobyric acid synthase [Deltaproteobacteria bacterium]|nr:cobyric acid synthase [Deltaproteobacteria bacterium]